MPLSTAPIGAGKPVNGKTPHVLELSVISVVGCANFAIEFRPLWLGAPLPVSPERDEAKVGSVEEAPSLPLGEEERAAADVRDHHRYRHRDRHGDVVQRLVLLVLQIEGTL